jgi:uncharacterized membrane protein (DUF373 family)
VIEKNYNAYVVIVLITTLMLFSIGYFNHNIHAIVIGALEFFILLEIIRSMLEYLLNGYNRAKVRYLVDGVIAWFFKEIYVASTYIQTTFSDKEGLDVNRIITLSSVILFYTFLSYIFFVLRKKVMVDSPDKLEPKLK